MSREDEMIETINDHKGQLMALEALVVSLLRAMPISMQAKALSEWDRETEIAKTALLNAAAPDQLGAAFDRYVQILNALRVDPPK